MGEEEEGKGQTEGPSLQTRFPDSGELRGEMHFLINFIPLEAREPGLRCR